MAGANPTIPSSAVGQRSSHVWEREANDWYVEPPWTAERLFATPVFSTVMTILDPACGMGTIVEAACAAEASLPPPRGLPHEARGPAGAGNR